MQHAQSPACSCRKTKSGSWFRILLFSLQGVSFTMRFSHAVPRVHSPTEQRKPKPPITDFAEVVRLIREANNILILTGAGVGLVYDSHSSPQSAQISTSCGIPDFRSPTGLYARLKVDYPTLPNPEAISLLLFCRLNSLLTPGHVQHGFLPDQSKAILHICPRGLPGELPAIAVSSLYCRRRAERQAPKVCSMKSKQQRSYSSETTRKTSTPLSK